jgi:hypothetical protein
VRILFLSHLLSHPEPCLLTCEGPCRPDQTRMFHTMLLFHLLHGTLFIPLNFNTLYQHCMSALGPRSDTWLPVPTCPQDGHFSYTGYQLLCAVPSAWVSASLTLLELHHPLIGCALHRLLKPVTTSAPNDWIVCEREGRKGKGKGKLVSDLFPVLSTLITIALKINLCF